MASRKTQRVAVYLYCSLIQQTTKDEAREMVNDLSELVQFVYKTPRWVLRDVYMDGGSAALNVEQPTSGRDKESAEITENDDADTATRQETNTGELLPVISEYKRLLRDIRQGTMDIILIKSLDNLCDTKEEAELLRRIAAEKGRYIYIFDKKQLVPADDPELTRAIAARQDDPNAGLHRYATKCLGYKVDENGIYDIDENEASTVRLIFHLYSNGNPGAGVARELTRRGIKTPRNRNTWTQRTVSIILKNPLYRSAPYLAKDGTAMMSPEIVDTELFDEVQRRIASARTR